MTGKEAKQYLKEFIKTKIPQLYIIDTNEIPTKFPCFFIKYPNIPTEIEGNVLTKTFQFETYLLRPVSINLDDVYEELENYANQILIEIKRDPTLLGNVELCEVAGRIETGGITFKVGNLTYEYVGYRIPINIYSWEV